MSILYRNKKSLYFTAVILFLAGFVLSFSGCNKDGVGIFYQISQEKAQADSKIAGRRIYGIAEISNDLYVLAGRSVYRQTSDDWTRISGDNLVYDIVADSGILFGSINNDDSNLDDGTIYSGGSLATQEFTYDGDIDLFQADDKDAFFIELSTDDGVQDLQSTDDLGGTYTSQGGYDLFDAAELSGIYYLISADAIYSITNLGGASITELSTDFDESTDGRFSAIAGDGSTLYLTTSGGQVYSSPDGENWTLITDSIDTPEEGSLAVVTIGTTDYLIIGTDECYYELDLSTPGAEAVRPTATADTSDPDEFDANYPDLAAAMVLCVYPSSGGKFYLGTSNGLWVRTSDGSFESL